MIKQPRARVCGGRGAGATLESIAYKNDECLFPDHGQDHGQARRLTLTQKERFQGAISSQWDMLFFPKCVKLAKKDEHAVDKAAALCCIHASPA
eukprot:scaffold5322_cov20-Tisochrysis_lutea.AAC.2